MSEKVYILFFSRRKPKQRAKVGLIANGLKSHESNGHMASTIKKSNCVQKTVFMKQSSNQQAETTNSTDSLESNGNKLFSVQKIGCSEKPVSMYHISAHHDDSPNSLGPSGIKTATILKPGGVQRPMSEKVSHHHSKANISTTSLGFNSCKSSAIQKSGMLMEHGNEKQSYDHHAQTSYSTKSKVDQGNSCSQRKLSINGSTNRLLAAGNIISIFNRDLKEDSGNTAVFSVSVEKQKTDSQVNERNGLIKYSEGAEIPTSEESLEICNGKNGPVVAGPLEGVFCENNNTPIASPKRVGCQNFQYGSFIGSSNKSSMKRKMEINQPCILLARDDQSRVAVEAFKELYVTANLQISFLFACRHYYVKGV